MEEWNVEITLKTSKDNNKQLLNKSRTMKDIYWTESNNNLKYDSYVKYLRSFIDRETNFSKSY